MDNSPTALFDTYEQDFKQIIDSIRDKLDGEGRNERGGVWLAASLFLEFAVDIFEQSRGKLR